jgi:hypothetical protein
MSSRRPRRSSCSRPRPSAGPATDGQGSLRPNRCAHSELARVRDLLATTPALPRARRAEVPARAAKPRLRGCPRSAGWTGANRCRRMWAQRRSAANRRLSGGPPCAQAHLRLAWSAPPPNPSAQSARRASMSNSARLILASCAASVSTEDFRGVQFPQRDVGRQVNPIQHVPIEVR